MTRTIVVATLSLVMAQVASAQASTTTISRTIVAPTTFGSTGGAFATPDVVTYPTEPNRWRKLKVSHAAALCGYIKQDVEHVIPPGTVQDEATGRFGYVYQLPPAFGTHGRFSLAAEPSGPGLDFDVIFYTSLGVCLPDVRIRTPSFDDCGSEISVPLEGRAAWPPPREDENPPRQPSCDPGTVGQSAFTRIGDDSGSLWFDADYAVVVMPIGVNGRFDLTLTY